jgi:hypothetical protein
MPTQVVVPSVSRAALLQGAAGTIRVETPSEATLAKPACVAGCKGPPTSGGSAAVTVLDAPAREVSAGGVTVVCAEAVETSRLDANANLVVARIAGLP